MGMVDAEFKERYLGHSWNGIVNGVCGIIISEWDARSFGCDLRRKHLRVRGIEHRWIARKHGIRSQIDLPVQGVRGQWSLVCGSFAREWNGLNSWAGQRLDGAAS